MKGKKKKYKKQWVFFEVVEGGTVYRENPPIKFEELKRMYASGDLLTTKELANYLGLSERQIYTYIAKRSLDYMKLGHEYYFSKKRIQKWAKARG